MQAQDKFLMPGPYYPLQGLRVLEFCWVWAGPFLGQFLADLGAEVIKIEWYDRFDVYRTRGIERMRGKVPDHIHREMSPSFHSLNRNKVGFTVNLKEEAGVDLVRQLAGELENFEDIAKYLIPQPGDLPKLRGIDIAVGSEFRGRGSGTTL